MLGIRYTRSLIPAESRGQLQQGNLIYDLRIIRLMYECALESSTRPLFIATGFVFATDHQLLVSEFVDGRAGFRRQDFAEFGGDPVFHQGGQLLSVEMYDPLGHFVYFESHGGFSYESGRKRNTRNRFRNCGRHWGSE